MSCTDQVADHLAVAVAAVDMELMMSADDTRMTQRVETLIQTARNNIYAITTPVERQQLLMKCNMSSIEGFRRAANYVLSDQPVE